MDMIRRHWEFWRANDDEWEEAHDDLFRAGIVLSVSAMDAYYTDRFCEALTPFIKRNGLNNNLEELICGAGFCTEVAIEMFDNKRPKRVLSNMVKRHLATVVTQNFKSVDGLYKCLGFNDSFTKAAQGNSRRKKLLVSISKLVERRHKIVHTGDYNQFGNLNPIEYNKLVRKIIELRKLVYSSDVLLEIRKI